MRVILEMRVILGEDPGSIAPRCPLQTLALRSGSRLKAGTTR
jgi:hypothetical protein